MKKYFHENDEALLEIPDFLLARNRPPAKPAKKVRRSPAMERASAKCPKGYKSITFFHLGDQLFPQIGTGYRQCFYKQGRKWVYIREAKSNSRAKKISLNTFKKLKKENLHG